MSSGYDLLTNEAAISVAQLLLNSNDSEDAVNYGQLSFFLSHSLSHMFDSVGWEFLFGFRNEYDGNHFRKLKCLEKQYNSTTTVDDNFSDVSGLEIAHRALVGRLGPIAMNKPPLKGYRFTNDQIFFISYAQNWCSKEEDLTNYQNGLHSPRNVRVLNPLKNSFEFAIAFNCPIGSPMNPVEKCQVW